MLNKIISFILQHIFPNAYAFWAEKVLRKKVKEISSKDYKIDMSKINDKIIEELSSFHNSEKDRKVVVEEKAKACLFIITISITLILAILSILKAGGSSILNFPTMLILIIGVAYLLLSGITAIMAIDVRGFHDIYLDDRVKENSGKLNICNLGNDEIFIQKYKNIKLNQLITNIRSNYVSATLVGIRNGIILIFIFFISSIGYAKFNTQSRCFVSSYFSPYDNIEDVIHAQLITATTSVHCSLYGIFSKKLIDDLISLKKKGVEVTLGLDKMQSNGPHNLGKYLKDKGINIVVKKTSALEHNKFCIIDDSIVIMGSWNWSKNAQKQENSDVLITGCPEQIKRFEDAFQRIMKRDE